ncbi:hypothetical protein [Jiangella anatolica]|uniref:Uncharacterized protein n=1 Tax=Jiangella anatolica TaxID=2670374 RepID=A0A2W2BMM1_9ACTN|nr:hypothetical protein [Jiangella anatolica]PZF81574.1 hypothetical protein C1I92_20505 [Jiangella anatolica]
MEMPRRGRFRSRRRRRRRRFADVLRPTFARELRGTLLHVQWTVSVALVLAFLGAALVAGLRVGP